MIVEVRRRLHHYKCKYGDEPHAHPPDDNVVAAFLSVAPWPRLDQWLQELALDRKVPGDSYAWFLTVAIQRLHRISPEEQRRIRSELRLVGKPKPAPPEQQPLVASEPDEVQEPVGDLREAIRAAAAGKGMR